VTLGLADVSYVPIAKSDRADNALRQARGQLACIRPACIHTAVAARLRVHALLQDLLLGLSRSTTTNARNRLGPAPHTTISPYLSMTAFTFAMSGGPPAFTTSRNVFEISLPRDRGCECYERAGISGY
jgi:hypothetical protein